jgi:hypothetical protein
MAYYAHISNTETTIEERKELMQLEDQRMDIIADNTSSDEYQTLLADYNSKNTSATLQALEAELQALYPEEPFGEGYPTPDQVDPIKKSIEEEKASLKSQQDELMAQMQTLSVKGTEAVDKEIQDKNEEISKIPSLVTHVYGGQDETITEVIAYTGDSLNPTPEELEAYKINYDNTPDLEQIVKRNSGAQDVKRTSYNTQDGVHKLGGTPFRKNYAGKGMLYDPVRDAFYHPSPYPSWTLDEDTATWQAPTPRPEEGEWYWKEDTQEWVDYYWQQPKNESPFPSWTYNGVDYIPPVEHPNPDDLTEYTWNEDLQQWDKTT